MGMMVVNGADFFFVFFFFSSLWFLSRFTLSYEEEHDYGGGIYVNAWPALFGVDMIVSVVPRILFFLHSLSQMRLRLNIFIPGSMEWREKSKDLGGRRKVFPQRPRLLYLNYVRLCVRARQRLTLVWAMIFCYCRLYVCIGFPARFRAMTASHFGGVQMYECVLHARLWSFWKCVFFFTLSETRQQQNVGASRVGKPIAEWTHIAIQKQWCSQLTRESVCGSWPSRSTLFEFISLHSAFAVRGMRFPLHSLQYLYWGCSQSCCWLHKSRQSRLHPAFVRTKSIIVEYYSNN